MTTDKEQKAFGLIVKHQDSPTPFLSFCKASE